MTTRDEHTVGSRPLGEMERGTPHRLAARNEMWTLAWTALCVLLAVWSIAWAVGAARGATNAWAYSLGGFVLLACALWARRSAIRNNPPRHL
ncbi:hypothetical protein [Streptomyces sp. NRRL S-1521]|uniref:hypothetical protein n=1 Tax=Streptomyces sp. NRRL S-1521 TaxID=1609100 RepID=UPI000747BFF0|nr:hypothetical protein [Streptomyces sp. NRRL S-1521]KUL53013.1 hypothetical protein ADL30_22105 [Streptomyces sp. NRRL S-1521]